MDRKSQRLLRTPHSGSLVMQVQDVSNLRTQSGFTLVEMLCAIIVLLLISGLMAVGVQLATNTYAKEVSYSEAQVLCATLRTNVSDELRYSGTTTVSDTGEISFFSQNYGEGVSFSTNEDGHVLLGENKLLSDKAYPYATKAYVNVTSYDATTRIFKVSVEVTDAQGSTLATSDFEVGQLNKPAQTSG